jgi:hypothetical protein
VLYRQVGHAVLLLDRAGWHTTAKLDVPGNITPIFLPSRAPEMFMMLPRKPVECEGLLDRFLDPSDEFWVAGSPFGDPCGEVLAGLFDRTAVVEPAQFLQAIVIDLARQMVEGVAEEVDVAALEGDLGKDLADG